MELYFATILESHYCLHSHISVGIYLYLIEIVNLKCNFIHKFNKNIFLINEYHQKLHHL